MEGSGNNKAAMLGPALAMNVISVLFLVFMFLTWDDKDLPAVFGLTAVAVFLIICPLLSLISIIISIRALVRKEGTTYAIMGIALSSPYVLYLIVFVLKLSTFRLQVM
jgi:hypothetical protein